MSQQITLQFQGGPLEGVIYTSSLETAPECPMTTESALALMAYRQAGDGQVGRQFVVPAGGDIADRMTFDVGSPGTVAYVYEISERRDGDEGLLLSARYVRPLH